ncbi:hypothetical protein CPT_Phriendly_043 [Vibrio phage Phriendly]|nr:hypothetical protein CPT_Phriendly_043 [Vibrio phage Phriendly]
MNPKLIKPLDVSIQAYKAEQADAQRNGTDIGTYPQWRLAKEKQDKFRQELAKANGAEEVKPKPKRKPRKKKVEE